MPKRREARFDISAENKASRTISKLERDLGGLSRKFKGLTKVAGGFVAAFAGGAAVRGVSRMISQANQLTDSLAKQSDRLGVSTRSLQAYRNAAELAGVSQTALEKGLARFNRNVGDVRSGFLTESSPIVKAFDSLGVAIEDIESREPEKLFEEISRRIAEIPDAATRSAVAMQLFGRSGQDMLTLFAGGAEAIDESRQLLEDLGLEINRLDARRVEAANDSFSRMEQVLTAVKQRIGIELAPALEVLNGNLLESARNGEDFGDKIGEGVSEAVFGVTKLGAGLSAAGNIFQGTFRLIAGAFSGLASEVTVFAALVVETFERTIPDGINTMLEATEDGLTRMKQGFADFATAAANAVVGGMNTAIGAVERLVNETTQGLNVVITGANLLKPGSDLPLIDPVQLSRAGSFDRFPVERTDLGRLPSVDSGLAGRLGGVSGDYRDAARGFFDNAGEDFGTARDALGDLFNPDGTRFFQEFEKARGSVDDLTEALAGPNGGGQDGEGAGGGGGGAAGAANKLADAGAAAASELETTFNVLEEQGQAAVGVLEGAIDDFIRNGELNFREFARSILSELANIQAKAAILGGLFGVEQYGGSGGGIFGALFSGLVSSFTGGAPSFAGGGYTGNGPRTGGLDGLGGFPAVLHPGEYVTDTRGGGGMGATIHQQIVIRETVPAAMAEGIAREGARRAKDALREIQQRGGKRRKTYFGR